MRPAPPPPPSPGWVLRAARRNDLVRQILPGLAPLVAAKAMTTTEAATVAADMAESAMTELELREGSDRYVHQRKLAGAAGAER